MSKSLFMPDKWKPNLTAWIRCWNTSSADVWNSKLPAALTKGKIKYFFKNLQRQKEEKYEVKCKPLSYFKSIEWASNPLSDEIFCPHYFVIPHQLSHCKEQEEGIPSLPVIPFCSFLLLCHLHSDCWLLDCGRDPDTK